MLHVYTENIFRTDVEISRSNGDNVDRELEVFLVGLFCMHMYLFLVDHLNSSYCSFRDSQTL